MDQKKLTAVVLTHNSGQTLDSCLKSLSWCDHIVVVDDQSTDGTLQIAQKHKAHILKRTLDQNFAQQRNWALKKVTTPWTLFIDSDEQVSESLKEEIKSNLKNAETQAFRLYRQDIFFGKQLKHGETADWNQIRLAKTDAGTWDGAVHEVWRIEGSVGQLSTPIQHLAHDDMASFLAKLNTYSSLAAQQLYQQGTTSGWWQIASYPKAKFLKNYIVKQGFRDGTHGFVHAMCMSFHSFLVRSKLFMLWKHQAH